MRLSPVYYVLTNGDDVEVYLYQMTVANDVRVMPSFKRTDLKQKWPELFKLLCKEQVLRMKNHRQQIIAGLVVPGGITARVTSKLPACDSAAQPSATAAAP